MAVIKHHDPKQLGEERVIWHTGSSPFPGEAMAETHRNLETEIEAETTEKYSWLNPHG